MRLISNRSGNLKYMFANTKAEYCCFVPKRLPPEPPILLDEELQMLLSAADRKLGRLDGITTVLPNPDLFVSMYVQKEAVLSSQIEGTQASLTDVLGITQNVVSNQAGVVEVANYVQAMNWGLDRLEKLPLSLRLLREIHKVLLKDVRGADKNPGEFRTSQNWIGPHGCSLNTATFVPPDPEEMLRALYQFELFMNEEDRLPSLVKIALLHAQFETIHPFLDGNGRMGRLLITFWLCQQKILEQPLLYLSYYFKQNRDKYYALLNAVRMEGRWEDWLKFFLQGVAFTADESIATAQKILQLKKRYTQVLYKQGKNSSHDPILLERLFVEPVLGMERAETILQVSRPTAASVVRRFCELGILKEREPRQKRNRRFVFGEYIDILKQGTEV